jgi:hypothetical protein
VHWSPPVVVNSGGTAVYPTVAASGHNGVAVAFYGTDRDGDANSLDVMGQPGTAGSAEWRVRWATSNNGGRTFQTYDASPLIHLGMLCTHGGGCSVANSRNLFDDFGMVFTKDGRATIAYTTDQVAVPGKTIGTLDTTFTASTTEALGAAT